MPVAFWRGYGTLEHCRSARAMLMGFYELPMNRPKRTTKPPANVITVLLPSSGI